MIRWSLLGKETWSLWKAQVVDEFGERLQRYSTLKPLETKQETRDRANGRHWMFAAKRKNKALSFPRWARGFVVDIACILMSPGACHLQVKNSLYVCCLLRLTSMHSVGVEIMKDSGGLLGLLANYIVATVAGNLRAIVTLPLVRPTVSQSQLWFVWTSVFNHGGLLLIERASKFLKRPKVEMVKWIWDAGFFVMSCLRFLRPSRCKICDLPLVSASVLARAFRSDKWDTDEWETISRGLQLTTSNKKHGTRNILFHHGSGVGCRACWQCFFLGVVFPHFLAAFFLEWKKSCYLQQWYHWS